MVSYAKSNATSAAAASDKHFQSALLYWKERFESIRKMNGPENPYQLAKELGEVMTENCTVVRYNDRLKKTVEKVRDLKERWSRCNVLDTGNMANRSLSFTNQLWNMFELGEVIAKSALLRDESRGAHYKPDFQLPEPKTRPASGRGVDGAVEGAPREVGEDHHGPPRRGRPADLLRAHPHAGAGS